MRTGIIGCGSICGQYLKQAANLPQLEVAALADLAPERAIEKLSEAPGARALSTGELLSAPDLDLVINLTVPSAHAEITLRALQCGKHVYSEKPLALNREEAGAILALEREQNLRAGCAPDTILGSGLQTARLLIEQGAIGAPLAFTAFMMSPGHEQWHPDPEFFYRAGGGPMFDMGPYYLSALLTLLGPVRRLSAIATRAIPVRTITSQPRAGRTIEIEVEDHICGVLEFASGAAGTVITSFAAVHAVHDREHPITIWGTEGVMRVPDPNRFDGTVLLRGRHEQDWREAPSLTAAGYGRAAGAADLADAAATDRPHRCSAGLAAAVVDLMQGFLDSSRTGKEFYPTMPLTTAPGLRPGAPYGDFRPAPL